jgi:hypothetical protein
MMHLSDLRGAKARREARRVPTLYGRGRKYFGADKTPCVPKDLSAKVKQMVHAGLAARHSR